LRAEVLGLADELGVLAHYCGDARRCDGRPPGLPDLLLAGPGGLAFAELKAGGTLDDGQRVWRDTLRRAGVAWYLWQPADWFTGRIRAVIERLAAPAI
jgi:hypothetical protein